MQKCCSGRPASAGCCAGPMLAHCLVGTREACKACMLLQQPTERSCLPQHKCAAACCGAGIPSHLPPDERLAHHKLSQVRGGVEYSIGDILWWRGGGVGWGGVAGMDSRRRGFECCAGGLVELWNGAAMLFTIMAMAPMKRRPAIALFGHFIPSLIPQYRLPTPKGRSPEQSRQTCPLASQWPP